MNSKGCLLFFGLLCLARIAYAENHLVPLDRFGVYGTSELNEFINSVHDENAFEVTRFIALVPGVKRLSVSTMQDDNTKDYFIIVAEEDSNGKGGYSKNTIRKAKLSNDIAASVRDAFLAVLYKTHYDESRRGQVEHMDGPTFYVLSYGLAGKFSAPDKGATLAQIVQIAELLEKLIDTSPQNAKELETQISNICGSIVASENKDN